MDEEFSMNLFKLRLIIDNHTPTGARYQNRF